MRLRSSCPSVSHHRALLIETSTLVGKIFIHRVLKVCQLLRKVWTLQTLQDSGYGGTTTDKRPNNARPLETEGVYNDNSPPKNRVFPPPPPPLFFTFAHAQFRFIFNDHGTMSTLNCAVTVQFQNRFNIFNTFFGATFLDAYQIFHKSKSEYYGKGHVANKSHSSACKSHEFNQ